MPDTRLNPWELHDRPSRAAPKEPSLAGTPEALAAIRDSGERQAAHNEVEAKLDDPLESVCLTAYNLVRGPRRNDYGHPLDDYTRTGRIWGAILDGWLRRLGFLDDSHELPPVPPRLACLMMQGVKVSREVNAPKRDNRVDGAGYWDCVQLIVEEEERRRDDRLGRGE
jgi:hypothetical protein